MLDGVMAQTSGNLNQFALAIRRCTLDRQPMATVLYTEMPSWLPVALEM